jgi:hypothetical protein
LQICGLFDLEWKENVITNLARFINFLLLYLTSILMLVLFCNLQHGLRSCFFPRIYWL